MQDGKPLVLSAVKEAERRLLADPKQDHVSFLEGPCEYLECAESGRAAAAPLVRPRASDPPAGGPKAGPCGFRRRSRRGTACLAEMCSTRYTSAQQAAPDARFLGPANGGVLRTCVATF